MCPIEKKSNQPSICVITPTLNEANTISKFLRQPALSQFDEVIIVDGGSTDNTVELLAESPFTLIRSNQPGRALQMNLGAQSSQSDILLFLHADCQLPDHAADKIIDAIRSGHTCGCFRRIFTPRTRLLDWTSELAYWRCRLFFLAFGDQAIFVRRDSFEQLGGYKDIYPFEDFDFCLRSKKLGTHKVIDSPIQTSARRFADAPLKRLLKDLALSLRYLLGLYRPK